MPPTRPSQRVILSLKSVSRTRLSTGEDNLAAVEVAAGAAVAGGDEAEAAEVQRDSGVGTPTFRQDPYILLQTRPCTLPGHHTGNFKLPDPALLIVRAYPLSLIVAL